VSDARATGLEGRVKAELCVMTKARAVVVVLCLCVTKGFEKWRGFDHSCADLVDSLTRCRRGLFTADVCNVVQNELCCIAPVLDIRE